MPDYLEVDGNKYEIIGYAEDGLPILKAQVITTKEGFDEEGNPKISVKINVPAVSLFGTPGNNGE